jgi:hypothetical protein
MISFSHSVSKSKYFLNAADPVLLKAAQFALVNATLNSNDFTTLLSFDANYLYRSLGVATTQVYFS